MPSSRRPRSSGPGRRPSTGRSGVRSTTGRPGDRTTGRSRNASAGSRRPGATRKPASAPPTGTEETVPTIVREESQLPSNVRQRASVTSRAIALAVVLLILTISYASSLRVYFNQRQDLATTREQIIKSQQDINNLSDEITRWNDPNYVRTQARIRLGWVLPGERGYRVIGPDGKPITGGDAITGDSSTPPPKKAWYAKLMGSVQAADHPKPAKPDATHQHSGNGPPVTENTKPTSKPTG